MNIGFGDATKLASMIAKLLEDGMTLPAKEKIVELRKKLVSLENDYLDLQQENRRLSSMIERREKIEFDKGLYWIIDNNGEKSWPICPVCHDKDGKIIRMKDLEYDYYCHVCQFTQEHTKHSPDFGSFPPDNPWGNGAW